MDVIAVAATTRTSYTHSMCSKARWIVARTMIILRGIVSMYDTNSVDWRLTLGSWAYKPSECKYWRKINIWHLFQYLPSPSVKGEENICVINYLGLVDSRHHWEIKCILIIYLIRKYVIWQNIPIVRIYSQISICDEIKSKCRIVEKNF